MRNPDGGKTVNTENLDWIWISVGRVEDLPEGRVKMVTARTVSRCLSHLGGKWAAMDNHCPHQGGPLLEGHHTRHLMSEAKVG